MASLGIFGLLGYSGWGIAALREDLRKTNPELDQRLKKDPLNGMLPAKGAITPDSDFKSDKSQLSPRVRWLRELLGIDPSSAPDPRGPQPVAPVPKTEPFVSIGPDGQQIEHGEKPGEDLGTGIAKGLGNQSSLIEGQANQILARVAAILQQGVTVPLKIDTSGVQAAVDRVHRDANRTVDAMLRSSFHHADFT